MRILFVVPYLPNLIRVRPYNLIRQLAARGHVVTVATLWTDKQERRDADRLCAYAADVRSAHLPRWRSLWNCLRALPGDLPLQAVYCWQPALVQCLSDQVGRVDVIHVEHLRGARYGQVLRARLSAGSRPVPVVWDSVDCITGLFRQAANRSASRLGRWLTRFEVGRTERHEAHLVKQFDRVLVTSPAERTALLSLVPARQARPCVGVLRNGVDLDYFAPGERAQREPATIVVSGKMSYHANITMVLHFVRNILPLIWKERPDVRLCVAGKDPPREVRRLAEDSRIGVAGTVGDIRPYLQHATLAAAPLPYGAGIQNKVLEAMACATPLVASPQAVSALAVRAGVDVLVEREPAAFAEAVLGLLANPERQRSVGDSGRKFVELHHRWESVVAQLEQVYDELVNA